MVIFSLNLNNYINTETSKFCINSGYAYQQKMNNYFDIKIYDEQDLDYKDFYKQYSHIGESSDKKLSYLADAFRMYILSKYPNHVGLDIDVYINPESNFKFDFTYGFTKCGYLISNGNNLKVFQDIGTKYLTGEYKYSKDSEVFKLSKLTTSSETIDIRTTFIHFSGIKSACVNSIYILDNLSEEQLDNNSAFQKYKKFGNDANLVIKRHDLQLTFITSNKTLLNKGFKIIYLPEVLIKNINSLLSELGYKFKPGSEFSDKVKEIEKIIGITSKDIKSITLTTDYFLINGHPTRGCNYHCSYCVSPKETYIREDKLLEVAENINNFINTLPTHKLIYFKLLGGEVAFYNGPKILNKINRINKISFTTNFSNSISYYKDLYIYMRSRNIKFTLMCSKHDENKDYDDKIVELTKGCSDYGYSLPIARLMVDNNFDFNNYYYLQNNKVKLNLSVIRQHKNKIISLNNRLDKFMKEYGRLQKGDYATVVTNKETFNISNGVQFANTLNEGGFDPTDFLCSAGHNGIVIEPDGSVYRCGCKGVTQAYKENISIKDFKLDSNIEFEKCFINNKAKQNKLYCNLCWYVNLKREDDN